MTHSPSCKCTSYSSLLPLPSLLLLLCGVLDCVLVVSSVRQLAVLSAMQLGREAWQHEAEKVAGALWGAATHNHEVSTHSVVVVSNGRRSVQFALLWEHTVNMRRIN